AGPGCPAATAGSARAAHLAVRTQSVGDELGALASAQPGHCSPARRRITHQVYRPRTLPCMNARALASASLTWSRILVHSSIADHLLVQTQPVKASSEGMHDRDQVVLQLDFWREHIYERVTVHHE